MVPEQIAQEIVIDAPVERVWSALTEAEITALFRSSNFPDAVTGRPGAADVSPWVRTFQRKVREITTRVCAPSPSR